MATQKLVISRADFEQDGSDEIIIEIYANDELVMATYATSSAHNGTYDKVGVKADIDNDNDIDGDDEVGILEIANRFSQLKSLTA